MNKEINIVSFNNVTVFLSEKGDESSIDFDYKGENITKWIVPKTGIYLLEVWGGHGGTADGNGGGEGGYTKGYIPLEKGAELYICVGEGGKEAGTNPDYFPGGFNGGGNGHGWGNAVVGYARWGSGGGATHIALKDGLLKSFDSDRNSVLIVAAGGTGLRHGWLWSDQQGVYDGYSGSVPGNQSVSSGTFGECVTDGGGGGWICGSWRDGSSGYIGGVPEFKYRETLYSPEMAIGGNTGTNGKARISYIIKTPSGWNPSKTVVYYWVNGVEYEEVYNRDDNVLNPISIDPENIAKEKGWYFVGWTEDPNSNGEQSTILKEKTADSGIMTLYAVFRESGSSEETLEDVNLLVTTYHPPFDFGEGNISTSYRTTILSNISMKDYTGIIFPFLQASAQENHAGYGYDVGIIGGGNTYTVVSGWRGVGVNDQPNTQSGSETNLRFIFSSKEGIANVEMGCIGVRSNGGGHGNFSISATSPVKLIKNNYIVG